MIRAVIYRLGETNIASAKFSDAWLTGAWLTDALLMEQLPKQRRSRAVRLVSERFDPDQLGQQINIYFVEISVDLEGFVWIVCVGHRFLFHFNSQLCKTV